MKIARINPEHGDQSTRVVASEVATTAANDAIATHEADTDTAHNASAIAISDGDTRYWPMLALSSRSGGGSFGATTVEGALAELGQAVNVLSGRGTAYWPMLALTSERSASGLTVKESDGAPNVTGVRTIVVSNGSLTDDGGGQVTISTGGGGGSLTVQEADGTPSVASVSTIVVSNGTLTDNGGGQVTIRNAISSGTSFPGTPATNDLFFRTDRGLLYYYDGTRWLTTTLYRMEATVGSVLTSTATDGAVLGRGTPWHSTYDLWLVSFYASTYVETTNNGTNYWTIELSKRDATNASTALATFNTSGHTVNNWTTTSTVIDALLGGGATYRAFQVTGTKTGSPGSLYWSTAWSYRLVG